MAFSAFRLLMSGSSSGGGPVVLTDTVTPQAHNLVQNQTGGSSGNPVYSITSMAATGEASGTKFRIYSKCKNPSNAGYTWFTWQPTTQSAGPTFTSNAPQTVGPNPGSSTIDITFNSNQGVGAIDDESNSATINWMSSTNTGPTSSASHNMGQASTAIRTNAVGTSTLNVAYALLADTTSHIYLFDQSGSQYDSTATGPSDISKNMQIVSLTNTLGVLIYANSSNLIKLATYNISGSTVSMDAAVSSGITAASGAKAVIIDSSHILLVYKKTTDTLGARVVNVATGSTFTFNTEYTAAATGITNDPIGNPGEFTSSGDFGVTWINANGQGCCTLMSVSGTAITLSNPNIYHTANNVKATSDYYSSYFIGLSSTTAAIVYLINAYNVNNSTGTLATKAVVVDLNYDKTANLWSSSAGWSSTGGNTQGAYNLGVGSSVLVDACSFGTDRYLTLQTNNSTTLTFAVVDNGYNFVVGVLSSTTQTVAGSANAGCVVNIGFSGTTARALAFYGYSNTTVEARLVQVDQSGGTITVGSATTVTSAGSQTAVYTINAINYATDKTLIFYLKSTGLYAAIVTTSGTSISSVANETQITNNTATNINLGLLLLDNSGNILLGYNNNGSSNAQVMIVNVSGTTITVGTPVTVGSGTNVQGAIGACLHPGLGSNAGSICFYDSPAGTPDIFVRGFTYSGTTLTIGNNSHNVSQWGTGINSLFLCKPQILSVQNNDALVTFTTGSSVQRTRLITAAGIDSYTIGVQSGPGSTTGYVGFLPQDCYHKATSFSTQGNSASGSMITNFYRV